jgi:hypothetical protein
MGPSLFSYLDFFIYIKNFNLISILLFKNINGRLILLVRPILSINYFLYKILNLELIKIKIFSLFFIQLYILLFRFFINV